MNSSWDDPAPSQSDAARDAVVSACLLGIAMTVAVARNAAAESVPVLAESSTVNNVTSLGVSLLIDVGFVIVVYLRGRTATKKTAALVTALVATAIDIGTSAYFVIATVPGDTTVRWLANSTTFLFVVAWGISRRRHPLWMVGLVPALVISGLLAWAYESGTLLDVVGRGSIWLVGAVAWFGALGLGCLACWGFDVLGRSLSTVPRSSPSTMAPRDFGC